MMFLTTPSLSSSLTASNVYQYLFSSAQNANTGIRLSLYQLMNERRTVDGSNNNLVRPSYNKANTGLARQIPALYADGLQAPMGSNYQPRAVSNSLGIVPTPMKMNPNNVTLALVIWGQFIDHDLSLTIVSQNESMPIHIPKCDPFMDVECSGEKVIPFNRSVFMQDSAVRDQMNSVTGWVDASMVYGSD